MFIIFVLIFLNTRSVVKTFIVLLAVPFSLGSFWLLYLLGYNMSIAVWVGIIALAGLDAETGVIMLLYLELAYEQWKKEGRLRSLRDLEIQHLARRREEDPAQDYDGELSSWRGLFLSCLAPARVPNVMEPIAAPMIGGVVTSAILESVIYPVIYMIWRGREFRGGE